MDRIGASHPASRRERGKRRRREAIKRAAFALFVEKGFERATVDEITRRADVAKGTFFSFFPSKRAVLVDYYRALDVHFFAAIEALDPDRPEQALLGYYRRSERLLRAEGKLARVLIQAIAVEPDLGVIDRDSGVAVERRVAAFLAESRRRGKLGKGVDPQVAARILSDIWSATVREWFEGNAAFSLSQRLAAKARVLFAGLAPVPGGGGRLEGQPGKRIGRARNEKEGERHAKEGDGGIAGRRLRPHARGRSRGL